MKKEKEKQIIDNNVQKVGVTKGTELLKNLLKENNLLVITNILLLAISVITFFILFFASFIVKNSFVIPGTLPTLISPFYEIFTQGGSIVTTLTGFAFLAIFLVGLVILICGLSFFLTLRGKKTLNKYSFLFSLISTPLITIILFAILIAGLIPINTTNLAAALLPLPGNIMNNIFDNISPIWIYYRDGSATLTTLGTSVMIITMIIASIILLLAILPFILRSVSVLKKNRGKFITDVKEKISNIQTTDAKETFRHFKKRIKIVNDEKDKKSTEKLISKNKKSGDNVDLKYFKDDQSLPNEEILPGMMINGKPMENQDIGLFRTDMIDGTPTEIIDSTLFKTDMIEFDSDSDDESRVEDYLDEIIGKDK